MSRPPHEIGSIALMDYSKLNWQEFEMLCARLLRVGGYTFQRQEAKSLDIGVDFTFSDPSGSTWVAEVKHFKRPRIGTSVIRRSAGQLNSAKQLTGADNGLLIVSMMLPKALKDDVEAREGITIWDCRHLDDLLSKNPEVEQDFTLILNAVVV